MIYTATSARQIIRSDRLFTGIQIY